MKHSLDLGKIDPATFLGGALPAASFDVIICGAGSAGSVLARRLSDDSNLRVLLIEAGGDERPASVLEAARWPENLGTERDWGFVAEPSSGVNGRRIGMSMGKALGGGSSINVMLWARGHQQDWDHFAAQAEDPAWGYTPVLDIYRRIEDWHGRADPRRGSGGPVAVRQAEHPHALAAATIEAARSRGIPTFDSPNGAMMEGKSGAAIADWRIANGERLSIFDSYVRPVIGRPNLTILTRALVQRLLFDGPRVAGVELVIDGSVHQVMAAEQVILSTGAINTPRILMHSGIGDGDELDQFGIAVRRHLPGVGQNLQDHTCFGVIWEARGSVTPLENGSGAAIFAASDADRDSPDILICSAEFPHCSAEIASDGLPASCWSLVAGLSQPRSRGRVRLKSADPLDAPAIHLNALSDPHDLHVARAAIALARDIGAGEAFDHLASSEVVPGPLLPTATDHFIRESAMPFWHQCGTARMGRDDMSVVGADLQVHEVPGLTIADGSIMPRITAGNTMAPCVVIGERASAILAHKLGATTKGSERSV